MDTRAEMGLHPRMRWKAAALKGKLQRMLASGSSVEENLGEAEDGSKSLTSDEERDSLEECLLPF